MENINKSFKANQKRNKGKKRLYKNVKTEITRGTIESLNQCNNNQ